MKRYNEKFWCWVLLILILLGVCSALIGCSTKEKVLTKQTYMSNYQQRFDSIFNACFKMSFEQYQKFQKELHETSKKETNHIRDSTRLMVDENGKIIGKESYHYESHNYTEKDIRNLRDSVSYYKAYIDSINGYRLKIDSLRKVKQDSIPYPMYIEEQLSKSEKMYLKLGRGTFYFITAFIALLIILAILKYKKIR